MIHAFTKMVSMTTYYCEESEITTDVLMSIEEAVNASTYNHWFNSKDFTAANPDYGFAGGINLGTSFSLDIILKRSAEQSKTYVLFVNLLQQTNDEKLMVDFTTEFTRVTRTIFAAIKGAKSDNTTSETEEAGVLN